MRPFVLDWCLNYHILRRYIQRRAVSMRQLVPVNAGKGLRGKTNISQSGLLFPAQERPAEDPGGLRRDEL